MGHVIVFALLFSTMGMIYYWNKSNSKEGTSRDTRRFIYNLAAFLAALLAIYS